ncbi:MAG: hypothetical protein KGI38_01585 [Thaumarchaeota archaeon]|nr:hypothetical protein [Nitrososphaerota archaeon]
MSPTGVFLPVILPPSFSTVASAPSMSATLMVTVTALGAMTPFFPMPPLMEPGVVGIPLLSDAVVTALQYSKPGNWLKFQPKALL